MRLNNATMRRHIFLLLVVVSVFTAAAAAQTATGFIFFSGTITSVAPSPDGKLVRLNVNVMNAPMSVVIDESTTVTGSLGGRISTSALTPNLFVEIEGWMAADSSVRAASVQTKVQSGAIRMYGRIENILSNAAKSSLIIDGVEVRVDAATNIIVNRGGIGLAGTFSELKVDDFVDVTAAYVDDTGIGQTTSGLFRASSIVAQRSFRIQGQIKSRTPSEGAPSIITVQGIIVTLTPDTAIVGNGMNERDDAFLSPKTGAPTVLAIEDDAGNPCTAVPSNCPDKPPADPALAGELRIGAFVRVEGMLENTGFSTRYTARLIQVEKAEQLRFQAIVESRTSTSLTVRINDTVRTQIILDASTAIDSQMAVGRTVEITARLNPDLSIVGRRIRTLQ